MDSFGAAAETGYATPKLISAKPISVFENGYQRCEKQGDTDQAIKQPAASIFEGS